MSEAVETASLMIGLAMLCIGQFLYWPALDHIKPEFRSASMFAVFWRPRRLDAEGQRIIRRAWYVQLIGLLFTAVAVIF